MSNLNWDTIESENASQFKEYAPEGEHTTTVESVELVTAKTGNKGIRFNLKETEEYQFPKYGVTFYNPKRDSWRQHHLKELFVTLGATEDQARKAVEQCEDKSDKIDAYVQMFTKFLPKQKPFEVVVFKENADDKYPTWDFKRSDARMTYPKSDGADKTSTRDVIPDIDEVPDGEILESEIPF